MTTATHPHATKTPNTAALNHWFKSALADHTKAHQLKSDWRKLLISELPLTEDQKHTFSSIPAADAKELQAAIAKVVDHGGTIHIERDSETSPGRLVVQPKAAHATDSAIAQPEFSLGIFHCTFDGFFRNWHCHWGPGLTGVTEGKA